MPDQANKFAFMHSEVDPFQHWVRPIWCAVNLRDILYYEERVSFRLLILGLGYLMKQGVSINGTHGGMGLKVECWTVED
jgi:hypothetical protein